MHNPVIVTVAGNALAAALAAGTWTHARRDITRLLRDDPTTENRLDADAQLITTATPPDRERVLLEVAQAWEERIAAATAGNPGLNAELSNLVHRLSNPGTTYNQDNKPGSGGIVFANQGGPQNVYQSP